MTALIIIAAVILLFVFLLTRYAGVILRYSDDFVLTVTYGIIRVTPGGKKKKPKKAKKEKKKKAEETSTAGEETEEDRLLKKKKKRETREAIFEMIRAVKEILPKFFGKMHFKSAKLHAKIAAGDAAATALTCGGAKAAASLLFETIDNLAVLDRGSEKNVAIEPDYTSDKSQYDIDLRFKIRVIWVVKYGLKVLKEFIKFKIKQDKNKIER